MLKEQNFDGFKIVNQGMLIIDNQVKEIPDSAFVNNTQISSIQFSENSNLEKIGEAAFKNCVNLEAIYFPKKLNYIGKGAFNGCTKLSTVELTSVSLEIDDEAFFDCINLRYMNIKKPTLINENNRTPKWIIGKSAFKNCSSLLSFSFLKQVSEIKTNAFANCTNLIWVDLSQIKKETNIEDNLFKGCINVTKYYYHHTWQKIKISETNNSIEPKQFRRKILIPHKMLTNSSIYNFLTIALIALSVVITIMGILYPIIFR